MACDMIRTMHQNSIWNNDPSCIQRTMTLRLESHPPSTSILNYSTKKPYPQASNPTPLTHLRLQRIPSVINIRRHPYSLLIGLMARHQRNRSLETAMLQPAADGIWRPENDMAEVAVVDVVSIRNDDAGGL
jgi:hypothetical protein